MSKPENADNIEIDIAAEFGGRGRFQPGLFDYQT
jgi:hypothetical protein